ncbi:MAG: glutamate-5-semialdehyde dehydrogenase [Atopobiaceae bacterium]|nr:glutamate-5-semialdehyde dehydrogenase [Atopobiaceae bacterium]MBQ6651187.1 glutamate-5-semialdehyde dehydrogenase [Atopobiaceae bacterium]
MASVADVAARMKLESPIMAATPVEVRNAALANIKEALLANSDAIFAANARDLAAAEADGVAPAVVKRLRFDEHKLADVCAGIDDTIALADPVGRTLLARELDEGLTMVRESCPIGVIGVIFEARPDALVQISTLCLKSGNCAILKGGRETANTNKALFQIIHAAAVEAGLPEGCLFQVEAREDIAELLGCDASVDLLIPRGSNAFVRYIMDNTRIPVMGHADGICHVYVDRDADAEKARRIVVDAKTQYVAVCNAAETLLIDRSASPDLVRGLVEALQEKGVEVRGTDEVRGIVACEPATDEDWDTEYLSLTISVRLVDGVDEAIDHINRHGSHHTDAIVTENAETAAHFQQLVDSAGVYWNCSTRFADGFRYGFGAEVGISTSKLHARGPVGLEGLVTYKYKICGDGHIVADYASGARSFHFRDL